MRQAHSHRHGQAPCHGFELMWVMTQSQQVVTNIVFECSVATDTAGASYPSLPHTRSQCSHRVRFSLADDEVNVLVGDLGWL